MLATTLGHSDDYDYETAQQLQNNLNSILRLFKDQKIIQKRAKQDIKEEHEKTILKLKNLHSKALVEKDDRVQQLIKENERLQAKCFDFEQKLESLRRHYDQLDSFRNSMISVLKSTAPSLLHPAQEGNHEVLSPHRPSSRINSHQSLITAAVHDQEFAMNARSFLLENGASVEGKERKVDLDSAMSDETAKPPSKNVNGESCLPFLSQVRPPTLLESALNDSFFEKVKVEQEKAVGGPSIEEELNIPELVHDTTFEQSGLLTIELLEPPIMGIDRTIDYSQRSHRNTKNDHIEPLPTPSIEPAILYRQIRECVTPMVFEQFADCIAKFNNGMDTSTTIKEIEVLVPDERLRKLMTRLILDASQS